MHYIRLRDNDQSFSKLKEQLIKENLGSLGGDDFLMCAVSESTEAALIKAISDYIWNVKFLDYVTRHVSGCGDCLREIDIIINTMNVANSFKESIDVVSERLAELVGCDRELNIDGFVTFRLRDFLSDFDNLLEFYNKSYEVENEYFDFICTLKECMCEEPCSGALSELHVVNCAGVSYIFNADGEDITDKCIEEYTFPCDDDFATRDDKIVSSLISMSPRVLHLHTNKFSGTPVLFDTLKAIFACRVIVN